MNPIQVIGTGATGWGAEELKLLLEADLICGGRRLLERLPEGCQAERLVLDASLMDKLEIIAERAGHGKVVVLASGDPLCCGIGGTLRRRFKPQELVIHPAPTAFQELFARLALPWEEISFFSVHGSNDPLPWRRILSSKLAVIYGDHRRPARKLAVELIEHFPEASNRPAVVGCELGESGDYVRVATLSELAKDARADHPLSMLALLPGTEPMPELPLGLADDAYLHQKNIITHPEVRAVVLSKLRLVSGVLWDIGAGSGSIGLEAAGLCSGLEVHAIEKDVKRVADLEANRISLGVAKYFVHAGDFREQESQLPLPNRIFVGGGGSKLSEILQVSFSRLKPGGVLVATVVMVETTALISTVLTEYRSELLVLNISRSQPLGNGAYFKAENPIMIAVFRKPKGV